MSKYRKFKPYIRKLHSKDKSDSYFVAMRIAYQMITDKPAFVLVQHGYRNLVVEVAGSKNELKRKLLCSGSFKDWQIRVKSFGQLKM